MQSRAAGQQGPPRSLESPWKRRHGRRQATAAASTSTSTTTTTATASAAGCGVAVVVLLFLILFGHERSSVLECIGFVAIVSLALGGKGRVLALLSNRHGRRILFGR